MDRVKACLMLVIDPASVSQLIKSSSVDHLPSLPTNMKPVALLTVDGENERMQVHKYEENEAEQRNKPPRSKSRPHLVKQKTVDVLLAGSTAQQQPRQHNRQRSQSLKLVALY